MPIGEPVLCWNKRTQSGTGILEYQTELLYEYTCRRASIQMPSYAHELKKRRRQKLRKFQDETIEKLKIKQMRWLSYRTNYLNRVLLLSGIWRKISFTVCFGWLFWMDMVGLVQGPRQVLPLRDRGQQDFFHWRGQGRRRFPPIWSTFWLVNSCFFFTVYVVLVLICVGGSGLILPPVLELGSGSPSS